MHIKVHNNKNILDYEGMNQLKQFTSKLKPGDEFYLKLLTKKQYKDSERSNAQNKLYHGAIMPLMVMHCDYLEGYELPNDNKIVHKLIKMYFCYFERDDLIDIVQYKHPITGRMTTEAMVPSWSFSSMPHKIATEMIEFCKKEISKYTGQDFETVLRSV